jgi:YidC/Oxa1 family membrane protein insertase
MDLGNLVHVTPLLATENALFKAVGDIFHPLFEAIAYSLAGIYAVFHTYAVAIIILTVVIMGLLTPLTVRSTRSMLAMQALQPEMQKLRAKFKGAENRQQLNEEMMKLYKEHGVSPTGGCLPMFLQMPAFIVLYDTIRGLANTLKKGQKTGTFTCHQTVCALPRYVPAHSAIWTSLHRTPGVMKSIGLNLAAKPLTHRAHWFDYIPYFALILAAVGLQYFQMAQMTRRNKRNNNAPQIPQQMQTMQRVMPLIFAYIYFLVPAGVAVYMVVSSGIRVLTQDLMFRYGLVAAPGAPRQVGRAGKAPAKPAPAAAIPAASSLTGAGAETSPRLGLGRRRPQGDGPSGQEAAKGTNGARAGQRGAATNGSTRGSTGGNGRVGKRRTEPAPPPAKAAHPRSKSKRSRRPR